VGLVDGKPAAGEGVVVASYTHDFARTVEPRLHIHNLVMNVVRIPVVDGDGRPVERRARIRSERCPPPERFIRACRVRVPVDRPRLREDGQRWPNVPIVFCGTRALAEVWTYRYLAAADTSALTEPVASERVGAAGIQELAEAPAAPEPTPAEVRAGARTVDIPYRIVGVSNARRGKPGGPPTASAEPTRRHSQSGDSLC
jgi:hypothetical protein